MDKLISPAKINLFLEILSKDDRGFHNINSVFTHIDLSDEIMINESDKLDIIFSGQFSNFIDHNNIESLFSFLIKKKLIRSDKYSINISKNIPVGAGLGGGSSNIAAILNFLKSKESIEEDEIVNVARELGSDIEFFLERKPAIVRQKGSIFRRIEYFKSTHLLLVYPNFVLSTKEVYKKNNHFKLNSNFSMKDNQYDLDDVLKKSTNMLEESAIELCPDIEIIINELSSFDGSTYQRMTGSGSCCFAVFEEKEKAIKAMNVLKNNHSDWWIYLSRII